MKELVQQVCDFDADTLWGSSSLRDKPDSRYRGAAGRPSWVSLKARLLRYGEPFVRKMVKDSSRHADATESLVATFNRALEETKEDGLSPRHILRLLGTEWGRGIDENVWVDYALRYADRVLTMQNVTHAVITDVRFMNEAKVLRDQNFPLWMIEGPMRNQTVQVTHTSDKDAQSQAFKDMCTAIIDNSGSLENTTKQLRKLVTTV
jgi:hypothetical protein